MKVFRLEDHVHNRRYLHNTIITIKEASKSMILAGVRRTAEAMLATAEDAWTSSKS